MMDLEKVIKQLEIDLMRARERGEWLVCVGQTTTEDAIGLLKSLEPVEPYEDENLLRGGWIGREAECCGFCGNNLRLAAKFCDRCGRKVKRVDLEQTGKRRLTGRL